MCNASEQDRNAIIAIGDVDEADRIRVTLEEQGYGCSVATDGMSALARLMEHPGSLLVADSAIEGIGSTELLEQVSAHDPTVFVILIAMPAEHEPTESAVLVRTSW